MRELTDHIVPGDSANHQLKIEVMDAPGAGGAHHNYLISGFNTKTNESFIGAEHTCQTRLFQNGPIKEVGVNGTTHEVELAILIDRLRSFQQGPYACADNQEALEHFEAGLRCLQRRTLARIARGVEGTHQK